MPGFASHYLFGQESLSHLKEDREFHTLSLHPHAFNLGLQGPDVFYYYLPAWLLYDKNIASHIHGEASLQFFIAMLDARNKLSKHSHRIIADAYICGFLGHYTLDTYCHPYIFARTHHLQNKDRNGGLYDFGRHVFLETGIDQEMISHFLHCKPTDFRPGDTIALSPKERCVIAKVLAFAIAKVYPDAAMPKWQIRGACRAMKTESRLMHDPSGVKKRIVRRLEAIFVKVPVISPMLPSDTVYAYKDPCNYRHKLWHNPWNPEIDHTESMYDLFTIAAPTFADRIHAYFGAVNEHTDVSMEDIYHARNNFMEKHGDLSYNTGLPLSIC